MVISNGADNVFVALITLSCGFTCILTVLGGIKLKLYIFQLIYLFTTQKIILSQFCIKKQTQTQVILHTLLFLLLCS